MRQHVLTAGHCLYDSTTGGLASDKITFYPSMNGAVMPFAAINAVTVGAFCRLRCHCHKCALSVGFDEHDNIHTTPQPMQVRKLSSLTAGKNLDTVPARRGCDALGSKLRLWSADAG